MSDQEKKAPKQEGLEDEKTIEVDREFIEQGFQAEVEKARAKIEQHKEERGGRTAFVAARSAEIGVALEVPDDIQAVIQSGLAYRRETKDAWGTAVAARHLKLMNPEQFAEMGIAFDDKEQQGMLIELLSRQEIAKQDPTKWGAFFAMAEHIKEVEPVVFEKLQLDETIQEGLKACLEQLKDSDLTQFIHVSLAAERCMPGILETMGIKDEALDATEKLLEEAEEAKAAGDVWLYTFRMSQIKGLRETVR
jgi:hypothetical protein